MIRCTSWRGRRFGAVAGRGLRLTARRGAWCGRELDQWCVIAGVGSAQGFDVTGARLGRRAQVEATPPERYQAAAVQVGVGHKARMAAISVRVRVHRDEAMMKTSGDLDGREPAIRVRVPVRGVF